MTQMEQALARAGVPVPTTKERVWRVIRDAPGGITHREVARRLPALPDGTISSSLHEMERREMIYSRGTKNTNPASQRHAVKEYFTDMERYELKDLPVQILAARTARKQQRDQQKQQAPAAAPAPAPTPVAEPQRTNPVPRETSVTAIEMLEDLTLRQLREVYEHLHNIFGKGK